ncbi:(2Fe-2S)-binding protein [Paenibacillus glycanilyticus]|uniref:IucA/IucC family C-terminal-domain containing protein n=1 Tax=Paenibacillus glycanilyticus TaxID=126569 RepID=UPI00203EB4FE|nr:IucA/IucC family C-terminal-domain containing protein [Paenibacillus glycanilyticus]MCM3629629.1 (2Fe-2S)-binding protein [Paenibacillus glycanilyticus]
MALVLNQNDIDTLTNDYRMAVEPSGDLELSLPVNDLLDPEKSRIYMERVAPIFRSSLSTASVSMFMKRYGFLAAAPALYAMSLLDKGLDCSAANSHLESLYKGDTWLPKLRLSDMTVSLPEEGKREEWRDLIMKRLFADNISLVLQSLKKLVPVSSAVLWENAAIYIFWLYEKRMGEGAAPEQRARMEEDFRYLVQEAPGHLFGESRNPLTRFYTEKRRTKAYEDPVRIRKTCCYYYQTTPGEEDFCGGCPKVKHEFV